MSTIKKNGLIVITGTPGVGKSHLASVLCSSIKNAKRIDLHPKYKELSSSYDYSGRCYVLNFSKVSRYVRSELKNDAQRVYVLDSHIAHRLNPSFVDLVIVLTCSELNIISQRLTERKYPKAKIAENLECEMFHMCEEESFLRHKNVISIDVCTNGFEKRVLKIVRTFLKKQK